jgi:hypothetical protein
MVTVLTVEVLRAWLEAPTTMPPPPPGAGGVTVIVRDAVVPAPEPFDAVSVTVCVPAANVCDGFRSVEAPPSPKFHTHDVGLPVEVSVKDTTSGAVPDSGDAMNDDTGADPVGGAAVTVIVRVAVDPAPAALDAVSVTVCVPAANVCDGFCTVDVPPSPKAHAQAVGASDEVSVKATVNGAVPDSGDAVNDDTGTDGPGGGSSLPAAGRSARTQPVEV